MPWLIGLLIVGAGFYFWKTHSSGAGSAPAALAQAGNDLASQLNSIGCSADASPFQNAWNAAGGTPSLTVDGQYGPCTEAALAAVIASPPASCFPGTCQNGTYTPGVG